MDRYGLVPDTDGPGRFRGGLGLTRELTVLGHSATINLSSDRLKIGPWGLAGGRPGGTVASSLELPTGECVTLPSKTTRSVKAGTRIILRTAGGGGYGDPRLRDPQHVRRDVQNGCISIERAQTDYGVQLDPDTLEIKHPAANEEPDRRS